LTGNLLESFSNTFNFLYYKKEMNLIIRVTNGNQFSVPIYPQTTYRALYDSVLRQLPQGSSGYLSLNGNALPYSDMQINYNDITRQGFLHFTPTPNYTDADDQYGRLGRRIADLGSIYSLWRNGEAPKDQIKVASDTVKEAIDTLIAKIDAMPQ
jgi:hypothetical protein